MLNYETALIFLFNPLYFVLFIADPSNILSNVSSVNSTQSFFLSFLRFFFGKNSISSCGLEFLFHGHTSWQMSHPKIELFIESFNSSGILSLFSIVRYDMHFFAFITWAFVIASVGQASIHLEQFPHLFNTGSSYSSSRSHIISARKKKLPWFLFISKEFLGETDYSKTPPVIEVNFDNYLIDYDINLNFSQN